MLLVLYEKQLELTPWKKQGDLIFQDTPRFWGENYGRFSVTPIQSGQIITSSLFSLTGIIVSKGNHPQMALIQISELL